VPISCAIGDQGYPPKSSSETLCGDPCTAGATRTGRCSRRVCMQRRWLPICRMYNARTTVPCLSCIPAQLGAGIRAPESIDGSRNKHHIYPGQGRGTMPVSFQHRLTLLCWLTSCCCALRYALPCTIEDFTELPSHIGNRKVQVKGVLRTYDGPDRLLLQVWHYGARPGVRDCARASPCNCNPRGQPHLSCIVSNNFTTV
jgi:hypothetical protein